MTETYSTYEAKAKLSEILRKVERGQVVRISKNGRLVAEIRPVSADSVPLAARIAEMVDRGTVVRAADPSGRPGAVAKRPGALARFLADRNR